MTKPMTPEREAAFRHDVDQPDCWALGVTRPEARALLASLDEARAQRDRNIAQAEEAIELLGQSVAQAEEATAQLEAERALRQQADEANCTLLRILDAVASRLSAEEAAEVARLAAKAVRR
jgi:hypothetical protein